MYLGTVWFMLKRCLFISVYKHCIRILFIVHDILMLTPSLIYKNEYVSQLKIDINTLIRKKKGKIN